MEDEEIPRFWDRGFTAESLMQQKQSSLTEQVKHVNHLGREIVVRAAPGRNSAFQEAQDRRVMLDALPCR